MNYLSQISLAPSAHIPHVPHDQATFDVGQGDEDRYGKKFSAEAPRSSLLGLRRFRFRDYWLTTEVASDGFEDAVYE
jgi:hypothetical protein